MSADVRILLAEAAVPSELTAGAAESLRRLGPSARIEILSGPAVLWPRALSGEVDVVVVDEALGEEAVRLLKALRRHGPPALVIASHMDDLAALAWFRHGAADCVAGAGLAEALPVAVLEQVRRWRALRGRGDAQRRIHELEHANEAILQNMNSAVVAVDATGRVHSCNAPAGQILGAPAEEWIGVEALGWFPDAEGRGLIDRSLSEGQRFKGAESVIERPDGSSIPVGVSCAPIASRDGELRGAVATFQDLSQLQQLQSQVMQTEKMASIGQLAAGVAHEINNPMGFIHANLFQMAEYVADLRRVWSEVEALQKAAAQADSAEIRAAAETLAAAVAEADVDFLLTDLDKAIRESQEGSERIRHIVQDLRDFSHQDRDRRVVADLNQCLDSTANIVWPMMKHLVVLEKQYQELPAVSCFPMELKQVFMNLLVNAYQAIEEKLGHTGETGSVQLRTEHRGNEVVVSVTDSGVGIASEHLDRIFDPFFTTKKVGAGTGLGLSTSYNLVQRQGGTLEVESELGRGTTFRLRLPVDGDEGIEP